MLKQTWFYLASFIVVAFGGVFFSEPVMAGIVYSISAIMFLMFACIIINPPSFKMYKTTYIGDVIQHTIYIICNVYVIMMLGSIIETQWPFYLMLAMLLLSEIRGYFVNNYVKRSNG